MSSKDSKPLLESSEPKQQVAPISTMFRYATSKDYVLIVVGLLATLGHAVLPGFLAVQVGRIFDSMDPTSSVDDFYEAEVQIAQTLFALGVLALFIGMTAVTCFIRVGTDQALAFRHAYFRALVNRPISYYDKNSPAQMASAVDMECSTIENASGEKIMVLFDASLMFINSWLIAFFVSTQLALLALVQLPLQLLAGKIIEGSGIKATFRLQAAYKAAGGVSEEALYDVKTVAANNAQNRVALKYQQKLQPLVKMQTQDGVMFGIGWSMYYGVLFLFQGVLFYVGAFLIANEQENWLNGLETSPGYVVTVFFAVAVSSHQLGNALPSIQYITRARVSVAGIVPLIDQSVSEGGPADASNIKGGITFENIRFSYPQAPEVEILKGFNLKIQPGQSVAIVGETGAGKSTIISMLQQFYEPSGGRILFDNIDMRTYNIASLRSQMGLVSQEPILFNTSIRENILVGKRHATELQMLDAARRAGVHEFVGNLPQQYDTVVGPKGSQLSGGQKQRIAIARAIIRSPRILLLDEATSALDIRTEASIQATLNELMKNCTTVMVAQRLSTVKKANLICVLKEGVVAEQGNHEELMQKEGIYSNLAKMQEVADVPLESAKKVEAEEVQESTPAIKNLKQELEQASATSLMLRVLELAKDYWWWLALSFIAAIVSGAVFPVFGYFFALNVTYLTHDESEEMTEDTAGTIVWLAYEAVVVVLALTSLTGGLTRVTALFTYDMRFKGLRALLYYDNEFFDSPDNHPAVLSNRLSSDCAKVNAIGGPVIGVQLLAVAAILVALVIGSQYSFTLALLVAICLPLIFIGQKRGRLAQIRGFALVSHEKATTVASDTMLNLRTVHAYNYQEVSVRKYYEGAKGVAEDAKGQAIKSGFFFGYMVLILYFTYGAASWYGAYLVRDQGLSFAEMSLAFFPVMFGTWAFTMVGALSPDLQGGIEAAKNLFTMIDYKPKIDASSVVGIKTPIVGQIEVQNLSFQYPLREVKVLKNLNFKLEPGQSLGIAGTTGSGKSTITQLLLRFYDYTEGKILIDGREITGYNIAYLRDKVGWVGQEPVLFSGTLRENLKFGNPMATDAEIWEACEKSQANEFIQRYEEGLDREVGHRGQSLSGGQKQRIGIARALVKKPKILILDEATSALDTSTEKKVKDSIAELNITSIAIAHRLSTIRDCNTIIMLELGNVVEIGTHEELVANQGPYYNMLYAA